jgi:hypothetical protein
VQQEEENEKLKVKEIERGHYKQNFSSNPPSFGCEGRARAQQEERKKEGHNNLQLPLSLVGPPGLAWVLLSVCGSFFCIAWWP